MGDVLEHGERPVVVGGDCTIVIGILDTLRENVGGAGSLSRQLRPPARKTIVGCPGVLAKARKASAHASTVPDGSCTVACRDS